MGGCLHPETVPDDPCATEFATEVVEGETVRSIGVLLPDDGAGVVHLRIAWPDARPTGAGESASDAGESEALWPQALVLQGGWTQAMATDGRVSASEGVVEVRIDLPGGGQSGGEEDRRGDASRAAAARALRWMAGEEVDLGGCTAPRRTRWGDPAGLFLVGNSNGGNLAVSLLADPAADLPPISGLVTWESPVSAEFANVEIGADPTVYTPGSCSWSVAEGLVCALPVDRLVEERQLGDDSVVCFDLDDDADCTEGIDVVVAGTLDPITRERVLSPELTRAAEDAGLTLEGYATAEDADAWWAWRDASRRVGDMVARHPDLPVMIIGSETDHVQTAADHPHVYGWGEALQASGAAWTRLNPGMEWLEGAEGENLPNAPLSLSESAGRLLTEDEETPLGRVLAAAVRELASLGQEAPG